MIVLCSIITFILVVVYYYVTKNHDYWKKRKVPYLKPTLLFGNYKNYILSRRNLPKVTQDICRKFPNEPYVGVFYGTDPALIIKDPDLIKIVMAKDFNFFSHREISEHLHKEPITQNMFFNGGDTWKVLRQNLTALFSSAKIKNMFPLIESCAKALEDALSEEITNENTVEIKSLLARYTMDCIGSCAFGVNTGTLEKKSSSNPFTIMGEKLFDVSIYGGLRLVSRSMWPTMFYKLGLTLFESDVQIFFQKLLTKVFESRQYKESSRNDFVDLILGWKKKTYLSGDSITNFNNGSKTTVSLNVDDNLLIGQCTLFFAAGFETTSTTISFLLYELAKSKDIQTRVLEEIDDYYQRHEGKIQYECVNEMPYLQACIDESLRIYPVLGILTREVGDTYTLPTGLCLEKGMRVHIPVYDLHHDPANFPDPEEFRPERFLGEEKKNIKPFTYLPFGEGPRICIGLRFSKMPMFAGLLTILKKHSVELAEGMPRTVDFQPRSFVTQAIGGINIKFKRRKA
ncbi:cytochrome P450 6B2-like [Vanessa cardui]|uniref:cytochrome P450 6B2-like n=1 Tax=Vanessa cardui TaxID=171605 RepID=UPI001F138C04|nr:cytochrome P450 6B2-like [Vanessa cardui]